jgi:hypothetical protein
LNDIIISGKLTENDIAEAKKEQRSILGEIKHVKGNLDQILTQTKNLEADDCLTNKNETN